MQLDYETFHGLCIPNKKSTKKSFNKKDLRKIRKYYDFSISLCLTEGRINGLPEEQNCRYIKCYNCIFYDNNLDVLDEYLKINNNVDIKKEFKL